MALIQSTLQSKWSGIFALENSRIQETPTLPTDADIRTDTNMKRANERPKKTTPNGANRKRANERPKKTTPNGAKTQTDTWTRRLYDQLGPVRQSW